MALLEIRNPALNLRSVVILVVILVGSLTLGFRAEAMDMTGAWATDATACKKMFSGPAGNLSFTEDADVYGSGLREKQAKRQNRDLRHRGAKGRWRRIAPRHHLLDRCRAGNRTAQPQD